MNRAIRERDLDAIYVTGPGHGGPGHRRERVPRGHVHRALPARRPATRTGLRELFRQFSFPGGIPSHVAPETPGSIHEGGELGYALAHAYGAAFDNPDLLVCCVVGDGEAETGPLAASWHSNKFLNPKHRRRRAADPPPERLQDRQPDRARADPGGGARRAVRGLRLPAARSSRATTRSTVHQRLRRGARRRRSTRSRSSRAHARRRDRRPTLADDRAAHAEGLDRPEGGRRPAGRGHLALAPGADRRRPRRTRSTCALLEEWMRSYRPEELFDDGGPARRRAGRAAARRATSG